MCESPYTMHWNMTDAHCPNLVEESTLWDADVTETTQDIPAEMGNPVYIQWGRWGRTFHSLAHVWSSWYREYYQAEFPRLIIRFEDLLFHTETVLDQVRECVGAEWTHPTFVYQTEPAKTAEYFSTFVVYHIRWE
jgi:hypothetical protein